MPVSAGTEMNPATASALTLLTMFSCNSPTAAAQPEAVAEARAERDDVLERAAQLDARDVVDGADAEGGAVEELLEDLAVGLVLVADRRLAELVLGHFVGDVSAHEHGDVHAVHVLLDEVGDEDGAAVLELDALDEGDRAAALGHTRHLRADAPEELVGQHEDEQRGSLHGVREVGVGDDVVRELDARQVLDVLVLGVDDVGQVLAVDALLEDPHGHLVVELVAIEHVAPDNLGDGRAPVARANDANLLFLLATTQAHALKT